MTRMRNTLYSTGVLVLLYGFAGMSVSRALTQPRSPRRRPSPRTSPRSSSSIAASATATTKPKGGIALTGFTDDASALKKRGVWEKVADNLRSGDMPPPGKPRPNADELDTINAWLDAVVFQIDCNGPRDPGRVTLRRLNRAEYNNTIRDLLGVDFPAGQRFPADDVGYGFDNIGDVLSMPPLLMEKYLAAAEKIVEQGVRLAGGPQARLPRRATQNEESARQILRALRQPGLSPARAPTRNCDRLLRFVEMAEQERR